MPNARDWDDTLHDLNDRRERSRALGGPERLARQHAAGKLDARARIDLLVDTGSFSEIGTLAGGDVAADAVVAGSGTIDGRPVMVGAEDFTTLGGSIGPASNAKRYRIAELALRNHIPLVMLLEGAGFRTTGETHGRSPTDLLMQSKCSGRVPVISAVLGASAGHGALVAPISDFCVMTRRGAIFTAGPPVVRESTGEVVTKEDLGGPNVALASGLVHNVAADDPEALGLIRQYLSYFPSSAWAYPPTDTAGADGLRPTPELLDLVPRDHRKVYDMRAVLDAVVDHGDWMEIQPAFGQSVVCALARFAGQPVAIVANNPAYLAGSVDAEGADKAAHFICVSDAFHLPLVFLADNPGVLPGSQSERKGVLRSGARMFVAQTFATTPKIHITLRKAYGFGSVVMSLIGFDGQVATYAYPGATLGAMGAGASSEAIRADEEVARALREAEAQASYRSAAGLGFDELIDPRETRNVIVQALTRAAPARQAAPEPVLRPPITP
ncbi:MAG TPA: carboxyl transferase domain-containing protein [Acidimicrobiales bacterium]|nr:carboxyl transferase domain-containing protein [Acidimicrobiales bacterium]